MEGEDSPAEAAAMSTILGKRKSMTTAGPDSGQLPAGDRFPGAFPAMQPAAAANTGETDAESEDEEAEEEDTNQMSLADGQFEAELPARMQRFLDDELEVLRVRARMRLRPGRAFADCAFLAASLLCPGVVICYGLQGMLLSRYRCTHF